MKKQKKQKQKKPKVRKKNPSAKRARPPAQQTHRKTAGPPKPSEADLAQTQRVCTKLAEAGLLNQEYSPEELKTQIEKLHNTEKHSGYHGESYGKKLARLSMYKAAWNLWRGTAYPGGWAVTLAGPQAPETGMIQCVLDWDHGKTVYVDRTRSCVLEAQLRAPASVCAHGDLKEVLSLMRGEASVGFAHLDFMGHITNDIYKCVEQLGPLLRPGAVIFFTYLRGRETDKNERWAYGKEFAKAWGKLASTQALKYSSFEGSQSEKDLVRFNSHLFTLGFALGKHHSELQPFWMANYQSGSPMSVLALQYMPRNMRGPRWRKAVRKHISNIDHTHKYRNDEERFRRTIIAARRAGTPAKVLADLFAIPPGRIAAWLAHDTMGTYRKKTV